MKQHKKKAKNPKPWYFRNHYAVFNSKEQKLIGFFDAQALKTYKRIKRQGGAVQMFELKEIK